MTPGTMVLLTDVFINRKLNLELHFFLPVCTVKKKNLKLKQKITAKKVYSDFPHESPDARGQMHKTHGRFMAKTLLFTFTELSLSLEPAPSPLGIIPLLTGVPSTYHF